jgi:hypothetical protein
MMRLGALLAAFTGAAVLVASPVLASTPDLTGVWSIVKPEDELKTEDGKVPPLLPDAKTVYEKNKAMVARGDHSFDSTTHCLPPGLPRLMLIRSPFEILQRTNTIYFVHELNRLPRRAYLNEKLPTDVDPHYLGYSVAHWDGDTLVIDTNGFEDGTLLDASGLPHSEALQLTERYELDKDGKHLHARFTIEDARTFSAPWSFKAEYVKKSGYELHEDVCADRQKPHLLAR